MNWSLFLLSGGVLCAAYGCKVFGKFRRLRKGIRITAVVVGVEERLSRSGNGHSTILLYPVVEYAVDGIMHRVRSIVGNKACPYPVGAAVAIVYDPRNPESMMLENDLGRYADSSQVMAMILICAGALMAVIGALGFIL